MSPLSVILKYYIITAFLFINSTSSNASALVYKTLDEKIEIKTHLVFLTLKDIKLDSKHIQQQIIKQINDEWGKAFEKKDVKLTITYETLSFEETLIHAFNKHDLNINYIILSKDPGILWSFVVGIIPGGNVAVFKIPADEKLLTKTYAHEFGHLLGLSHPEENLNDLSVGIMLAPSNDVQRNDPNFYRSPSKDEVLAVLSQINWHNNKGLIGHLSIDVAQVSPMQYPAYFRQMYKLIKAQLNSLN